MGDANRENGGFPLPKDAIAKGSQPGGGGKILLWEVPRGKETVVAEVKAQLAADGWTIDAEETSPRGAVRMDVSKGPTKINARLTGDATRAALILTLP